MDQIQNLSVDLVTTRCLLDAGTKAKPKRRSCDDGSGPSTSKGQANHPSWGTLGTVFIALEKGKKDPSEARNRKAHCRTSYGKPPSRAGSEGASSRGSSISFHGAGYEGPNSSSSESNEDVPRTT